MIDKCDLRRKSPDHVLKSAGVKMIAYPDYWIWVVHAAAEYIFFHVPGKFVKIPGRNNKNPIFGIKSCKFPSILKHAAGKSPCPCLHADCTVISEASYESDCALGFSKFICSKGNRTIFKKCRFHAFEV